MKTDWHELIQRYLVGRTTDEETDVLQTALKADAHLRTLYLDYMNLDVALEAAEMGSEPVRLLAPPERRSVWLQWRPLTAAAAGVLFGMFCTSMVWAYVGPYAGKSVTLFQESFESGATKTMPGLPLEPGVWSGDEARVVASDEMVEPKHGAKMLRFVSATYPGEDAKRSAWGDVYRLVDLRGQAGGAKSALRLSADFDAVQFPEGGEYSCSVELCVLDSDPKDAPQPLTLPWVRENSASTALRKIPLKGDGLWQKAEVEVAVSPHTHFVLVHLAVLRTRPYPPVSPVQFDGHYLDAVKLELLTQPNLP